MNTRWCIRIALVAAAAAAVALLLGVPAVSLLSFGALLLCPLMMVFMMRGMHGGQGGHSGCHSDHAEHERPADRPAQKDDAQKDDLAPR